MKKIILLSGILTMLITTPTFADWQYQNNNWKYYDNQGYTVSDEWKKSGDNWYYLDYDENMATDKLIYDDGDHYYVDQAGKMVSNQWQYLEDEYDDGEYHWFYFQGNGKAKQNGFLTIDGVKYHFTDGRMDEGWIQDNEDTYYTNPVHDGTYGSIKTGWVYIDDFDDDSVIDEEGWYYFGTNGKMVSGTEKKINGYYYVFNDDGLMLDGFVEFTKSTATSSNASDNETVYKFYRPENGDRIDGWYYVEDPDYYGLDGVDDDSWFYFKNGIMFSSEYNTIKISDEVGVARINGEYYGFDKNGQMITDFVYGYDNSIYYFDVDNGDMKTGKVRIDEDSDSDWADEIFYFADSGKTGAKGQAITGVKKGYLYDNGLLIKADSDVKYEVFIVDGQDYLVNRSGKVMDSGTYKDGDDNYWVVQEIDGIYNISKK